jgi:hypothetical protein
MKIQINIDDFSQTEQDTLFQLVGHRYTISQSGKEKSEELEKRLRDAIKEGRPNTTDYDFCHGKNYFFEHDKVELKQFDATGASPKLQQVKPALYNKILVCAEFPDRAEWWLLNTDVISKKAGKEHKEDGKLTLTRQHKGNECEGQITFTKQFKTSAIKICETNFIDYKNETLGLGNDEILHILNFVKNH